MSFIKIQLDEKSEQIINVDNILELSLVIVYF